MLIRISTILKIFILFNVVFILALFLLPTDNSYFTINKIEEFGQTALGLTSADFNQDGNTDFAVSYTDDVSTTAKINIFYGDGKGEFTQKNVYSFSSRLSSIDSGDYDNDGDIDIIIGYSGESGASKSYGIIAALLNQGDEIFSEQTTISTIGFEVMDYEEKRINPKITSADYDNDGDIDLIIGDNSGKVEIYVNDDNGVFTSAGIIYDYGDLSWGLSSVDFDSNGDIDCLVLAEFKRTYSDNYTKYSHDIYLKKNLINSNNPGLLLAECFDQSAGVNIAVVNNIGCLSTFDFEKDGDIDIITGIGDKVTLLTNENGDYESEILYELEISEQGYPDDLSFGAITSSDYNNDGYTDFVIGGTQGNIHLFLNNLKNEIEQIILYPIIVLVGLVLLLISFNRREKDGISLTSTSYE